MKRRIQNCFTTTGISLLLLAMIATLSGARFLLIESVYQTLLANALIHLGLWVLERFESRYFLLEICMEIGYILVVLILAGLLFDWYTSTSPGILVMMGIVVYFSGSLIDVFHIHRDVQFINTQLKLRRKQSES